MMTPFVLAALAAVASHDLLDVLVRGVLDHPRIHRSISRRPIGRVIAQVTVQAVVVAVVVVACLVHGGPSSLVPAAVAAVVMVGWAWTHSWWRPAGAVLTAMLTALALIDLMSGRLGGASGIDVLVVGGVVVLFLMETSNRITRSVLSLAGRQERHARPVSDGDPQTEDEEELELKGGRFIGPMERILVVGLALSGAEGIIGALMAAKGIVRFPEISADRHRGGRAEEFLVGSLTSWGLAAAGVLLVWIRQNT